MPIRAYPCSTRWALAQEHPRAFSPRGNAAPARSVELPAHYAAAPLQALVARSHRFSYNHTWYFMIVCIT